MRDTAAREVLTGKHGSPSPSPKRKSRRRKDSDSASSGSPKRKSRSKNPIVDSGAARSVCPPDYGSAAVVRAAVEKCLRAVTGHTATCYGNKKVKGTTVTNAGRTVPMEMSFAVTDVWRPVLAVEDSLKLRRAVWFTPSRGCGVCADKDFNFEIAGDHLPLRRRGGVGSPSPVQSPARVPRRKP